MEYTREEYIGKLIPQGRKIEEFIRNEVQPYLTKEIEIGFGDVVHRGRFSEITEHEFSIYVRKDEIVGTCGGLSILFNIKEYQRGICGWIDVWNDYSYGGKVLFELCLNWQTIKRKLLADVCNQTEKRRNVLENFQI